VTITAPTQYSLISPIPESHHELLVLGTAIRLQQFDSDKDSSSCVFQYQTKLEQFKADIAERFENFNKQTYITCEDNYVYS
jgi:hypothetical protein